MSGLKINATTTKAVWVENKKYSHQIICPNIKFKHFKVLGFYFSLDLNCITDVKIYLRYQGSHSNTKKLAPLILTILGKITVIKTIAL